MKLFFIESFSDTTLRFIHEKAIKVGIESSHYNYGILANDANMLSNLDIDSETVVFMALPFTANKIDQNFQFIYEIIREKYSPKAFINEKMLQSNFLKLEDKYYQTYLFNKHGIPHSKIVDVYNIDKVTYPCIVRKRISSRSKNNFIISNSEELKLFKLKNDVTTYVFQEYYKLKGDYRVHVIGDKVYDIVKRDILLKENNKITVKVNATSDLPEEVKNICRRIANEIGADFLGVDVGEKENGEFFIIEYNGRAQIKASEKRLKLDISGKILNYIIQKYS